MYVCIFVCETSSGRLCVFMCVCIYMHVCLFNIKTSIYVAVTLCVCVRERERQRGTERDRTRARGREETRDLNGVRISQEKEPNH